MKLPAFLTRNKKKAAPKDYIAEMEKVQLEEMKQRARERRMARIQSREDAMSAADAADRIGEFKDSIEELHERLDEMQDNGADNSEVGLVLGALEAAAARKGKSAPVPQIPPDLNQILDNIPSEEAAADLAKKLWKDNQAGKGGVQ